jgi:5-methyltetrahydropteroyltriglutamate--homocysteine methyltransferase
MTTAAAPRFATELVGSWCKPTWLADHDRVYGHEGTWWRLDGQQRADALDDAVRLAVYDQERAGLTYVTDGEQRRQTFSGHFYSGFGGIDSDEQGAVTNFSNDVNEYLTMKKRAATSDADGKPAAPPRFELPRVTGPLTWEAPILGGDVAFLRASTDRLTKVTVIGPVTLALRLVDEHYGSLRDLAFALAAVLNQEVRALEAMGVDLIQLDEPEAHFRYSQVADFAVEAIDRALAGLRCRTAVHMCYGYSRNIAEKRATPVYAQAVALLAATSADEISLEYAQPGHGPELLAGAAGKTVALGVLSLDTEAPVESADEIVARAEGAVGVLGPEAVRLAPDCGMWFLPRPTALAKISAMEAAARVLRQRYPD